MRLMLLEIMAMMVSAYAQTFRHTHCLGMHVIDMTTHSLAHIVASREGECVGCVIKVLVEAPALAGLVSSRRKGQYWHGKVD